ncbi:LCP family protein [Paenibacillus sp. 481]|uniref:LCP family protein n=1 Tax=Paenibacillus sp. 481 TaxID=2835869 RepID=UPI001E3739DB|nr:LCP family protein [Paenibacillus sp. 481]UHA74145.1 LCP family protein [Paenibacillus sp. 481]
MKSTTPLPPRNEARGRKAPATGTRRGMPKWLKVLLTAILLVAVAIGVYAGYLFWYANNSLDTISTAPKQEGGGSVDVTETLSPQTEPFAFVILGTDHREDAPGLRSDVVMVGGLHPETKEAVLISLPRDTYTEVEGYRADKLTHYYPIFHKLHEEGKLDSASPEDEMKKMLGTYMGINFDHIAVINFNGFVDLVDAVGGVNVNVDQNMCYRDSIDGTNIKLKQGEQKLEGKQALDFVRYRKSNCRPMTKGTTDFDRNKRQNEVISEIVGNMQSLGGVSHVFSVIDAISKNFKMDMTPDQMRSSLMTYFDINRQNIHYISVDGEWRSPYIYVDEQKLADAKQTLQDVLAGKSLKTAPPASADPGSSGTPGPNGPTGPKNSNQQMHQKEQ